MTDEIGAGEARTRPRGIELTARERRWLDALLVLSTVAMAFVVLGFAGQVMASFGDIILVFFLAWLLAFILSPVVSRLTWTIPVLPRVVAVMLVYGVLLAALGILIVLIAGAVLRSISDFVAGIPQLTRDLPGLLAPWEERLREVGLGDVDLASRAQELLANVGVYADRLIGPLQGIAVASLGTIGNLLLVFVLSLYLVADRDAIVAFLFRLVPPSFKDEAAFLEQSVSRSFGGFLRGQAVIGIAYGLMAAATSFTLGLGYLAATSTIAGVLMAIPFFGPFLAWAPPILVAVVTAPPAVLPAVIAMGVGWLVVMNFLAPRVMADALRIHPVVVLGSVIVGLKIAGIAGAIFGIPIAGVISAFFLHSVRRVADTGTVTRRAARRVAAREGRPVRLPREPDPARDPDVVEERRQVAQPPEADTP
jgi:predicted PurR-regulated permease PerM